MWFNKGLIVQITGNITVLVAEQVDSNEDTESKGLYSGMCKNQKLSELSKNQVQDMAELNRWLDKDWTENWT